METQKRIIPLFAGFLIVPLIVLTGLGWVNYRMVKSFPDEVAQRFEVQWQIVRQFARQGISPYAESVPISATTANPSALKTGFTAPLYSAFVILPFALIDDMLIAKSIWLVLLEVSLILSAIFILRFTGWKPGKLQFMFLLLFSLFSFHSVQALILGDTTILVVFFLILAINTIRDKRMELAGFLLALATMQPRMVILVILFIILWTFSNRSWKLPIWFAGSLSVLVLLGVLFIPDWPLQYLRAIWHIRDYYLIRTLSNTLKVWLPGIGSQLGIVVSILVGLILLIEWVVARKKEFRWFLWTVCLTLILKPWIGIPFDTQDFLFYLLPLGLILSVWDQRLASVGKWLGVGVVVLVFAGQWLIFSRITDYSDALQSQIPFLLINPLVFFFLTYWIRWWATHPYRSIFAALHS